MTHPAPLTPDERLEELVKDAATIQGMLDRKEYQTCDQLNFLREAEEKIFPSLLALPAMLQKAMRILDGVNDMLHDTCEISEGASGEIQQTVAELRAFLSTLEIK